MSIYLVSYLLIYSISLILSFIALHCILSCLVSSRLCRIGSEYYYHIMSHLFPGPIMDFLSRGACYVPIHPMLFHRYRWAGVRLNCSRALTAAVAVAVAVATVGEGTGAGAERQKSAFGPGSIHCILWRSFSLHVIRSSRVGKLIPLRFPLILGFGFGGRGTARWMDG